MMISVFGSDMSSLEALYVQRCLDSQWIGFGKKVSEFERQFADSLGFDDMVMVDSGSNALFLAIKLLELPEDGEVILPSLTWISCANAVVLAGLKPVFADVDLRTMCLDPESVRSKINERSCAIMTVHFAGYPSDVNALKAFGLPVIEDSAHAVYSTRNGVPCGLMGDVGIFSFDAVKNLAVGEGGGIVSTHISVLEKARELRYCGIRKSGFESAMENSHVGHRWWEYELKTPFIKMLPTNIAASIGLAQLERRFVLQKRREQIWNYYLDQLAGVGDLILPIGAEDGNEHSFFTFVIATSHRDSLARYLLSRDIYTTLRYQPLNEYPVFGQTHVELANTKWISDSALSIPLHPRLSDMEMEAVVKSIVSYFRVNRT